MSRGKSKKPVNLSQEAQAALIVARNNDENLTFALSTIASCITQMHDGYEKEVVSPSGQVVVVTEKDLRGAGALAKEYIKLLHELNVTAEPANQTDDNVVSFIQRPLVVAVDPNIARAAREGLENG